MVRCNAKWNVKDIRAYRVRIVPGARHRFLFHHHAEYRFGLVKRREKRTEEQHQFIERLRAGNEEIGNALRLGDEFLHLVREQQPDRLEEWLTESEGVVAPEMRSLAKGLRQDQQAVDAALRLPWSNGPVEGHVNRLKVIKRQMYGRAKFDLLRLRVLNAS